MRDAVLLWSRGFEGRARRRRERLQLRLAWALPKWLLKWAVVRAYAVATTGAYGDTPPDTVTYRMLCERNGFG